MKLLLIVLLAACAYAAVHRLDVKHTGSLRQKLIKQVQNRKLKSKCQNRIAYSQFRAGTYEKFLLEQQKLYGIHNKKVDRERLDGNYVVNITLGTPPQKFTVFPDTDSANLWVTSSECKTPACKGFPESGYTKKQFDKNKSKTFHDDKTFFSITYEADFGSLSGHLGTDVFQIGGFTAEKQQFGLAFALSDKLGYDQVDGFLGLGWPALAVDNVVPPVQNIMNQFDQPLFTVWLKPVDFISSERGSGLITFGGLDTEHCHGEPAYVPLSSETYWQFTVQGFTIGKYTANINHEVVSDINEFFIGGPRTYLNKIAEQVQATYYPSMDMFILDCSKRQENKTLIFHINGNDYPILMNQFIVDVGLWGIYEGKCGLGIMITEGYGYTPQWILGEAFIRSFCNVYDVGNARIGFQPVI